MCACVGMVEEEKEKEMPATYKARQLRIQVLAEEIKTHKRLSLEDIYKFGLNRWLLSSRTITDYIKDLVATGNFKIESTPNGEVVEYIGGE